MKAKKERDVERGYQKADFVAKLRRLADAVETELPSGVGTKVDVVVRQGGDYWFYEIKTALTARGCLREAIGQLLEYAFWPGAQEPSRLVVVGEARLDKDGREYLSRLKERFALPIEYEQITV